MLLGACAIATLAAFAQAVSGFGFALVGVPLMTVLAGPRIAITAVTVLSGVTTLLAVTRERRHVDWRIASTATTTGLLAMPLGLVLLTVLSVRTLSLFIATMVVVFTVLLGRGWSVRATRRNQVTAGLASGALLTSTGMNGPPLVIAFDAMGLSPYKFRGTLQATFCAQDVAAVVGFLVVGALTRTTLLVALAGLPGLPLGWLIGDRLFARLDAGTFRRLALFMLLASAVLTAVSVLLN